MASPPLLLACIFVALCFLFVDARTTGEKFDGYFAYINTSLWSDGQWIPWNSDIPRGSINYRPAYYGALYGNMSVVFGQQTTNFSDPALTLRLTAAYAGAYTVDEASTQVRHVPEISTTSSVPPGEVNARVYMWYDYDNLLNLLVPGSANLWWRRINEFPRVNADVTVIPKGDSWIDNGVQKREYELTIHNNGPATISQLSVRIDGGMVYDVWEITRVGNTNEFQVNLYGGLESGATLTPGFVATGSHVSAYLAQGETA